VAGRDWRAVGVFLDPSVRTSVTYTRHVEGSATLVVEETSTTGESSLGPSELSTPEASSAAAQRIAGPSMPQVPGWSAGVSAGCSTNTALVGLRGGGGRQVCHRNAITDFAVAPAAGYVILSADRGGVIKLWR
jgi:hypothetical protein